MESLDLLVPAVATMALGGALLVPVRDGRHGRKATLGGAAPFFADFHKVAPGIDRSPEGATDPTDVSEASQPSRTFAPANAGDVVAGFAPVGFFKKLIARLSPSEEKQAEPDSEVVCERSFAEELSSYFSADDPADGEGEVVRGIGADATPIETCVPIPSNEQEILVVEDANDEAKPRLDIRSMPNPTDRVVPLTRLPLRFQTTDIAWPSTMDPPITFATPGERYAFLRRCATDAEARSETLLARAFGEETPEGRSLVLAALRRSHGSPEAVNTFTEALRTGCDEERALAVDALSEAGARAALARALTDRIDAIAAKAALAYVGTTAREDYRVALSPFLDDSRIEAILGLLAGVVE